MAEEGRTYPVCTAGGGACPPEDCGGTWGYAELKQALTDPEHDEHELFTGWLGLTSAADFDPAAFNSQTANDRLLRL